METVYRERSNGQWEYWLYSDHRRVFVSHTMAMKIARQGARLVTV